MVPDRASLSGANVIQTSLVSFFASSSYLAISVLASAIISGQTICFRNASLACFNLGSEIVIHLVIRWLLLVLT